VADTLDLVQIRSQYPALSMQVGGRPVAFLDNPAGTQVPQVVIDAVVRLLPGALGAEDLVIRDVAEIVADGLAAE